MLSITFCAIELKLNNDDKNAQTHTNTHKHTQTLTQSHEFTNAIIHTHTHRGNEK